MSITEWNIGNGYVQRKIVFTPGEGIRTVSYSNPVTGKVFCGDYGLSDEFLVQVDGKILTGSNSDLTLYRSLVEEYPDKTITTIMLDYNDLIIELRYTCFNDMPVISKSLSLRNTTYDQYFTVDGIFASEHMSIVRPPDMRVQWVNGITDPHNQGNVYSYLDYGVEEHILEPDIPRILTNQVPPDMRHMQQWVRGKLCSVNHSNFSYFPWAVLWDPADREGIYMGLEWSGPWMIDLSPSGDSALMTISYGNNFKHTIGSGQSISGLPFFQGVFTGDFEDAGISTQLYTEKHITAASARDNTGQPTVEPWTLPYAAYNSWWQFEDRINEELLMHEAEEAAKLGFEAFVIDYGWSVSARDKRVDTRKFPSGLKAFSEHVKKLRMKFGVWVCITGYEPELVPTSDPYEWSIRTEDGTIHDENNIAGTCACLASDYKFHLRDQLDYIITEYGIDWLKYDQNMFINCYAKNHHHQNEYDSPYFQVLAFYEILDYLLEKHPNLFIECALSGAMVLDYGILKRSHTCWLHDEHRAYHVRRIAHGASYPLPPRFITCPSVEPWTNWDSSIIDINLLTGSTAKRKTFDSVYRASAIGEFITFDKLTKMPTEAYESLKDALEFYKTQRRRIHGPIRHLTAQPRDPREWDAYQIYDERIDEGLIFIFRPSTLSPVTRIRLKDLVVGKTYSITSENTGLLLAEMTGWELMESGLMVRIDTCTSCDILYLKAE